MLTHSMPQNLNELILTLRMDISMNIHYVLHLCHCPSQTETGFLETQRNNKILENKSLTIFNCIGINYGESHFDSNKIHAHIILQLNTCYGKHVTIHAII